MKGLFLLMLLACASLSTVAAEVGNSQSQQMRVPATIDAMRDFLVDVDESYFDPSVYSPQVEKKLASLKSKAKWLVVKQYFAYVLSGAGRPLSFPAIFAVLDFALCKPKTYLIKDPDGGHLSERYLYPISLRDQMLIFLPLALASIGMQVTGSLLIRSETSDLVNLAKEYNKINPIKKFLIEA